MSSIKDTLREDYLNQLSELLEPLSITGISVSPNHRLDQHSESLTGQMVLYSSSGTPYFMKWSTSIYGSLDRLIGMATELALDELQDEWG
jgi:hypothetical protein